MELAPRNDTGRICRLGIRISFRVDGEKRGVCRFAVATDETRLKLRTEKLSRSEGKKPERKNGMKGWNLKIFEYVFVIYI